MRVSALESGFLELRLRLFVAGSGPNESVMSPSLSFSLRHSASGDHLLFDLGIRKKWETHPPAVQQLNSGREVLVLQSADESLRKGGIEPANVKTVIISHLHWDQCVFLHQISP